MRAAGVRVGSHIFAEFSIHLLACVDDPGPVEVFTWSDPLLEAPARPDRSGRLAVRGPGFGVTLDEEALRGLGQRVTSATA